MSEETIDAIRLAKHAGITYRQLDYWTTKGWLTARNQNPGPGTYREYPLSQAKIAETMAQLTRLGIQPGRARDLADSLVDKGHAEAGPFLLARVVR